MIKKLEERLAERKSEYEKLVTSEYKAQRIIDALPTIFTNEEADNIRVYENGLYIDLFPASVEVAELTILPTIAELTKEKWHKTVEREEVTYSLSKYEALWYVRFKVQPKIEGTCRIIARATGKIKRSYKYVDVEEPEVEYIVDCTDVES